MARTVDTSSTFENWRQNYNDLATDVGALGNLTTGDKTSTLAVYYSECGKIGRERSLILKNEKKEILKTWNFPNTVDEHKPMTLNTTEVLGLIKSEKAYLYYSSKEVNHSQILASVVSSPSPSAKK